MFIVCLFLISHLPFYCTWVWYCDKRKIILQINELHLDNATKNTMKFSCLALKYFSWNIRRVLSELIMRWHKKCPRCTSSMGGKSLEGWVRPNSHSKNLFPLSTHTHNGIVDILDFLLCHREMLQFAKWWKIKIFYSTLCATLQSIHNERNRTVNRENFLSLTLC